MIILTTFDLDEYVYGALRAGASGFLPKDVRPTELVEAIRVVARGDALLAASVTRRLLDRLAHQDLAAPRATPAEFDALTEREREVLELVAAGLSKRGDRRAAGHHRSHDQDPRVIGLAKVGPARPGPGGGLRLRHRLGPAAVVRCVVGVYR